MKNVQEKKKYKLNEVVRKCDCKAGNLRYGFIAYADKRGMQEFVNCDWFLCNFHWQTKTPLQEVLSTIKGVKKNECNTR